MKKRQFLRHILEHGCLLLREGARHSVNHNPVMGKVSPISRHTEVNDFLARKICRDLGIPLPS